MQERLEEGGPYSRGGSKAEFILRRREGGMGRGNWWMLASPVQVPPKGKRDIKGLSPAWQASTGGYRSILVQADQCMYSSILTRLLILIIKGGILQLKFSDLGVNMIYI